MQRSPDRLLALLIGPLHHPGTVHRAGRDGVHPNLRHQHACRSCPAKGRPSVGAAKMATFRGKVTTMPVGRNRRLLWLLLDATGRRSGLKTGRAGMPPSRRSIWVAGTIGPVWCFACMDVSERDRRFGADCRATTFHTTVPLKVTMTAGGGRLIACGKVTVGSKRAVVPKFFTLPPVAPLGCFDSEIMPLRQP